jgi:hypothetical protein
LNKTFVVFFILLFPLFSFSQNLRWKKQRRELVGAVGASNFLGDLGGANRVGTHFIRDFEFLLTRPAVSAGFRYRVAENMAVKSSLHWALISGNDRLTKEPYRNNRNLSFRSNIFEASSQFEYSFIKEKQGHRYKIKNVKGLKKLNFESYLFGGVGLVFFNPKGKYNGKWYALQPLGTEGQGLIPGKNKYKRYTLSVPVGFGIRYPINREMVVGFEYGLRYTLTDYMDDVSTDYYDKEKIRAERGDIAAHFSDPSLGDHPNYTIEGEQRGNPKYKDAYMFGQFTFAYKISKNRRRTRAKF